MRAAILRVEYPSRLEGVVESIVFSRSVGFATRSFPLGQLEERTLDFAERAAKAPVELQQLNKRSVHRAMEIMGARAAMRAGFHHRRQPQLSCNIPARRIGVKSQLDERDTKFGYYRTRKE